VLRWTDEHGNTCEHRRRAPSRGPSLATLPAEPRLVDAYCPSGHLTAVLSPNGAAPPLVMVHNAQFGPVPALVLLDDGIALAMTSYDDDGKLQVSVLGPGRPARTVHRT
jgi:hypothetical protein